MVLDFDIWIQLVTSAADTEVFYALLVTLVNEKEQRQ